MISTRKNTADKNEWQTPRELFDLCVQEFGEFDLDAAASDENHLCRRYFTKKNSFMNKLYARAENVWMNPPFSPFLDPVYGKMDIDIFLRMAAQQVKNRKWQQCVCLVPAQPSAHWFYHAAQEAYEIRFLTPRVNYVHPDKSNKSGANGGSAIIRFNRMDFLRHQTHPIVRFWKWK